MGIAQYAVTILIKPILLCAKMFIVKRENDFFSVGESFVHYSVRTWEVDAMQVLPSIETKCQYVGEHSS